MHGEAPWFDIWWVLGASAVLVTLSGTPVEQETWAFSLNGGAVEPISKTTTTDVTTSLSALSGQLAAEVETDGTVYEAFQVGSTAKFIVYRTDATAFTVENQAITTPGIDAGVDITVSGTPVRVWQTIVTPEATIPNNTAPATNVGEGDEWTLTVGGTAQNPFTVTTENTMAGVATGIAGTVNVTNVSAIGSGNTVVLTRTSLDPVAVGPVKQVRAAAYDRNVAILDEADAADRYATVVVDIDDAGGYESGKTYVVLINGQRIEFTTVDDNRDGTQKLTLDADQILGQLADDLVRVAIREPP